MARSLTGLVLVGIPEAQAGIAGFAESFVGQMKRSMALEWARGVRELAMRYAPVKTGFLRDRHKVEEPRLADRNVVVAITNDAVYAARVHATHPTKSGWMRRALAEKQKELPELGRRAFTSTKVPAGGFKKGTRGPGFLESGGASFPGGELG